MSRYATRRCLRRAAATLIAVSAAAGIVGAQVSLVEDINPGSEGMGVHEYWTFQGTAHGSALYFAAETATAGNELWVSQGTAATTGLVEDIWSGTNSSDPQEFVSTAHGVYFTAVTGPESPRTLWRTDGQDSGTHSLGIPASSLVEMDGSLFFSGADETNGGELWKATGDAVSRVSTIPGNWGISASSLAAVNVEGIGTRLFFFAHVERDEFTIDYILWMSDGTPAGTVEVKNILDGCPDGGCTNTHEMVEFDGRAFFPASGPTGHELWASDGTEAGTVLIKDISPTSHSYPNRLTVVGDLLFFLANSDGNSNGELWVSDGTTAGTFQLLVSDNPHIDDLTPFNGRLFFTVWTETYGKELWTSDGTVGGTTLFADLYEGGSGSGFPNSSSPKDLAVAGGLLFFGAADTGRHGRELWVTDGTVARTLLVHDLKPISTYEEVGPRGMIEVGDRLFFFADDGVIGHELYTLPTTDVISQPTIWDGPASGRTEEAYTYTAAGGVSVRGNPTQLKFHWGDDSDSGWLDTGVDEAEKTWDDAGDYDVWVEAKSDSGASNPSAALTVDIDFTEWAGPGISGPTEGFIDNGYSYTITGESSYGHDLEYAIDWGDGGSFDWEAATWTGLDPETNEVTLDHTWTEYGDYIIEPRVRCATHNEVWGRTEVPLVIVHETVAEPTIDGPDTGDVDTEYTFTIGGESDAGHDLEYLVDWGDGSDSGWQAFGEGVTSTEVTHTWTTESDPEPFPINLGVRCIAHPTHENWTETSIEITAPPDEELTGPDLQHVGGDWNGYPDVSYTFTLSASSNLEHPLEYRVDWDGDMVFSDWTAFGEGVTSAQLSHTWTSAADWDINIEVRCVEHTDLEVGGTWQMFVNPEEVSDYSLDGPGSGIAGVSYPYTLTAHTTSGHAMQYQIYWGHGDGPGPEDWFDLDPATGTAQLSHAWPVDGVDRVYQVDYGVRCKDHPSVLEWGSIEVSIPGETIVDHTLDGPTEGLVGVDLEYTVTGTSSQGHALEYKYDWGDGFPTEWADLTGGSATQSYAWAYPGEFTVTASVRCATHNHVLSERQQVVTITSDTPPGWIFGDDFEYGDTEDWSAAVGLVP